MFVEQLRRAVEASPRVELAKVASLLWRAYAAGQVSEAEAQALSDLIEARRALPAPQKPPQRRVGSRPRSPASMERRRRWAASGALPPALAARFTLAETAVLAVIAAEVLRHSRCTLTVGHLAALAGVSETTVRNALREARGLGLLSIEERRLTGWRNAPNVVRIVSREWLAWLRLRASKEGAGGREGGCKLVHPTPTQEKNTATTAQRNRTWAAEGQGAGRVTHPSWRPRHHG
jgi:Bacterial regulatory proteins, gntR family